MTDYDYGNGMFNFETIYDSVNSPKKKGASLCKQLILDESYAVHGVMVQNGDVSPAIQFYRSREELLANAASIERSLRNSLSVGYFNHDVHPSKTHRTVREALAQIDADIEADRTLDAMLENLKKHCAEPELATA